MDKLTGFGASTVEGVGDSQGGFFRRLEKKLADAGKPHQSFNLGKGGNTLRDMLLRLDDAKANLPGKVIILLGCNDMVRADDETPEKRTRLLAYEQYIKTLFEELNGPDTIFVTSFAVSQAKTGIDPEAFASYMAAARWIGGMRRLKTWDLHTESLAWGDRYLTEDGLHYNDEGHEMIAERLLGLLL